MKQIKLYTLIIFSSCAFINLNAQGIIVKKEMSSQTLGTDQQQLNYFAQQSNEALNLQNTDVTNSGVFINQIGKNNSTDIATQSQISDIQLTQLGNSNQIKLKLKADVIDYSVTQKGNNNLLLEYNTFTNKQLLERTVQQNGNGQNLVIHGRNSIVDKMKITMNKGSQSLIIRNTN